MTRHLLVSLLLLLPLVALAQGEDEEEVEEPVEEEESALTATTSGDPAVVRASPTPLPPGLGRPVLFRGECTPGGGPAACRVTAAAFVSADGIEPIPCTDEKDTRAKLGARYFAPGTELDLYVRGAPNGTFVVAAEDPPVRGCGVRATGRRLGAPASTYTFVALHPEDPAALAAIRFPSGVQPTPQSIAVKALAKDGVGPQDISVRQVRRFRDLHPTESVLVIDALAAGSRAIVVAEGNGPDPAGWRITWTNVADEGKAPLILVDTFDLGADGKAEILLERVHRGEPSEWHLLRRDATGWRTE